MKNKCDNNQLPGNRLIRVVAHAHICRAAPMLCYVILMLASNRSIGSIRNDFVYCK